MSLSVIVEPTDSKDLGVCPCCGRASKRVWGQAYFGEESSAAYFVELTLGHILDQGANIDLIVGKWGDGAGPEERKAVALAYRLLDGSPSMMVIDADTRPFSSSSLVGQVLGREDVIGTAMARDVYAIADAILTQDGRIAELLGNRQN